MREGLREGGGVWEGVGAGTEEFERRDGRLLVGGGGVGGEEDAAGVVISFEEGRIGVEGGDGAVAWVEVAW